jgi:hypothetical protein
MRTSVLRQSNGGSAGDGALAHAQTPTTSWEVFGGIQPAKVRTGNPWTSGATENSDPASGSSLTSMFS